MEGFKEDEKGKRRASVSSSFTFHVVKLGELRKDLTHKKFERTLFIRTKHTMRIFGIIPFIKLRNDT